MQKKTFLFVDGSNLYGGQYELFGPTHYLNFSTFIKQIEQQLKQTFDKIFFYTSYSPIPKRPTRKQTIYLKNEAFFYRSVRKTSHVVFFKGYRSKTSGKEKEVDVKLTADLVSLAFLSQFDDAYLCSGDADFLQALLTIKRSHPKKKLTLLCLENKIMHKGSYRFPTVIFRLHQAKIKFRKNKAITIIDIDKKKIAEPVP